MTIRTDQLILESRWHDLMTLIWRSTFCNVGGDFADEVDEYNEDWELGAAGPGLYFCY